MADPDQIKFYTLEEVSKNNGKDGNRVWIIVKDSVYDATDYLDDHPGGGDLITERAGKDATKAFNEFGHSGDAKRELKKYKIGEISEEERSNKSTKKAANTNNVKVVEASEKENRRSCCNYLTCGFIG